MSWSEIKKKKEEEEKKRASKKSNSDVSRVANNLTGSLWKNIGQNIITSERNAEIRKQKEQQTKERLNQIKVSPNMNVSPSMQKGSTFKRNIQPSTIQTTPTKVMTQQEKEYAKANTPTWQKVLNFANNAKSEIDRKSYDISENVANQMASGAKNIGNKANNVFKKSDAFDDGYQFGDIYRTADSTTGNLILSLAQGLAGIGTNTGKFIASGVAQIAENTGHKEYADRVRKKIATEEAPIDKAIREEKEKLNKNSIAGKTTENLFTGVGQIGGYAAATQLGVGAPVMFASAAGGKAPEVYSKENVTAGQAWSEMVGSGAISMFSERLFGLFGKSGLDKGIANKLASKLESGIAKSLVRAGVSATGEGAEELIEYTGNQLLDRIIDKASRGKGAKFSKDWDWNGAIDEALDAFNSSLFVSGGQITSGAIQNKTANNTWRDAFNQAGLQQDLQERLEGLDEKEVQDKLNQIKSENQHKKIDNKDIDQEIKTSQNGFSQAEKTEALRQEARNKLESIKQNYDENSYNQMQEFIETAPSEKALNQVISDLNKEAETKQVAPLKQETKNKLEETYKSERFTESQDRKRTYAQYQRQNNTTGIQYDNSVVDNALDAVAPNRNGRRTVGQWKQVAEQIGLNSADLTKSQIDDIAYGSWFDLQPTKNITRYDNRTKEHKGFEKFTSDDWINTIYESAKGQKIKQIDNSLINNEKTVSIQQVTEEDYLTHAPNYYDGEQFDYNEHRNKTTKKVIREIIDIIDNSSNIKQDLIKAYQENEKSEGNHNELKTGLDEDNRFNYQYKESALSNFIDEINKGKNIKESEMYRLMKDYLKEQYSLAEQAPQNNFKYEKTDNQKVNTLYESTSKYFDDSEKTHNMLKPMEKIIRDKGYNITFDDTLGDNVNGRIRTNENGETEITINPNSNRKGEFIIGHELTHAIETQEMVDLVKKRMEKDGELRNAVEDLKKLYGTDDINGEVLADISGQLFGNQEFINNLSIEKPSVFKRIYDKIISLANKITGNSNEALFIKDLKNKWEKAYRENTNNIKEAQYSETNIIKDNQGRQLSNQQQEYFKDSKVRDENGNLLTVYHGTMGDFNIFDIKKAGINYENSWSALGRGFYFTPNYDSAKEYASSGTTGKNKHVKEVYINVINPFNISKDYTQELSSLKEKYNIDDFYLKKGYRLIKLLNEKNIDSTNILQELGFDGIIEEYSGDIDQVVAFYPNQIKNIDNKIPTTNPDIRYSLSEDGAMKDNKTGKKVTLQAESMNDGKNLLAIHNLDESKLKGVLELGGFPVPSIAITNPDIVNHSQFGDISVIFNKNTINPETDTRNEVYDRDVWSPTFPQIEYDVNVKALNKVRNIVGGYGNEYLREANSKLNNIDSLIGNKGYEKLKDELKDNKAFKYVYYKAINPDFKIFTKMDSNDVSTRYSNQFLKEFIDEYGKEIPSWESIDSETRKEIVDKFKKKWIPILEEKRDRIITEEKAKAEPRKFIIGIAESTVENNLEWLDSLGGKDKLIENLNEIQRTGGTKEVKDYSKTNEFIDKNINQKDYEQWLDDNFKNIVGKKGIYNGKEYLTSKGNRRTFNQLHEDYNLSNLVKELTKQSTVAGESGFGAGQNFGTLQAKMSNKFNSIQDIKNAENRIQYDNDTKKLLDKYSSDIYEYMNELREYSYNKNQDYYYGDNAGYALNDFADYKVQNVDNLKKALEKNGINSKEVPSKLLNDVVNEINELKNIPTDYFEAKPQRAVGFDEIDAIVIPKDVSKEVKQQLKDRGIKTIEYDRNNENERADILKSLNEYKFSKTSKSWQDYLEKNYKSKGTTTDLRDIRLPMKEKQEVKAPIKQQVLKGNDGKTLKVYHGSPNANITEFDSNKAGSNTQSDFEGIYFTDNPSIAEDFSYEQLPGNSNLSYKRGNKGKVYENNLKYNNVLNLNNLTEADIQNLEKYIDNDKLDGISKDQAIELMKKMAQNNNAQGVKFYLDFNALKNDYDLIIADMGGKYKGSNEYIVFNNNQIISNDNTVTNKQEVKAPLKQGNVQQNQNNNTPGENINWNEIERPENNQKFRKHYRSIIESSNTTAEAKAVAKELMGRDTYVPETNKGQLAQADQRIMTSSPEVELQALRSRVLNGERITSVDIAVGERLIQYFSKTGSAEQLQDAIQTTALAGTSTGQTLQALTILNHQTPQGQVTWLQRSIDKMNKELAKKKGGTITTDADGNIQIVNKQGKDITNKVDLFNLTPEMMNKIMQSENQEQMLQNIDEVYEELGQQVPKSMLEKVDSWRYFSMLANMRTHGRNMIGNFAMGKMQRVKDKIAGGIEDVVSKFNPEMERTKTLRRADKKTKEFAKNDFKNVEVQSRLELNESKFNPQSRLQNARRTFKSDAMENTLGRLFNLNDKLLEAEDGIGLKAGYQKALADYITANKIDVDNITDAQLSKARNYAVQQAKEATFHQANAIASAVTQFQNKNNLTKFAIDALLPFKKTPMNVAKAGMEYSPLQIAKSATIDVVNLRKGNISINQYIDNLSKGMTGTGIALAGYALANAGILKASGGDDKDKEKYEEEQGKQSYSIQIAGKTYSLDWLAPTGIPLFIGAETHKLFNQEETEKSTEKKSEEDRLNQAIKGASNLLNAGATAINPMSEMSMISGLTSALSSYNTSDNLGSLGNMMTNMGKSYVNQFFPTLMGQVAKTGDEYERTTKSTATGTIGKAVDQTINQIKNKIPGLRQTLPIKTDIWGNDVKQEVNLPLRAVNNFINPATVKNVSTDKVDMELNKLYEENHSSSLLPDILTKTVQLNKQTYRLSNKEYAEFTKNYGQTSHKLIENFIKTSDYNKLTQEQKETAISNIYSYAKEQNKMDYAKKVNETVKPSTLYTTMKEIEKNGGKQSEYLSYLAKTKGMSKEREKNKVLADSNYSNRTKEIIYTNGTGKDDNLYNNLLSKSHINMTEYLDYKDKVSNKVFSADKDKNGKTVTGSAKAKVINYLNNNITGVGNRLLIAGKSYALQNNEKQKLAQYINSIVNTREERIEIYKQLDKNFYVRNGKVYMRVSK